VGQIDKDLRDSRSKDQTPKLLPQIVDVSSHTLQIPTHNTLVGLG
jgi:hypothetical protein